MFEMTKTLAVHSTYNPLIFARVLNFKKMDMLIQLKDISERQISEMVITKTIYPCLK